MTSCQPSLTSNTALMLISNKDHLSTDFEDLSNYNHTISATATTPVYHDSLTATLQETDTAIAMNLEGSTQGGYLTVGNASHSAWNWGSGEWTIEFSFKPKSTDYALLSKWSTSNDQWRNQWFFDGDNNVVNFYLIGPNGDACSTYPNKDNCYLLFGYRASTGEAWTHVAAQRVNNGNRSAVELYVDGCLKHRVNVANDWHVHQPSNQYIQNLLVGQYYEGVGNMPPGFQGHFDNIRIEKGKALYTGDFLCSIPCFSQPSPSCSSCPINSSSHKITYITPATGCPVEHKCCTYHNFWTAGYWYGAVNKSITTTTFLASNIEMLYNGYGATKITNSSLARDCWKLVTPHYSTLDNHPHGVNGSLYWKPHKGFGQDSDCCACGSSFSLRADCPPPKGVGWGHKGVNIYGNQPMLHASSHGCDYCAFMNGTFEEFGTHLGNPAWINPSTNAVIYFDPCEGRFWGRVTASSGLLRTLSSFRFQDEDQPSHNGEICFAKQLKPNEGTGHPGIEPDYNSPCPPPAAPAGWRAGCPGRAEWLCMNGTLKTGPGNVLHHEQNCSDDYRFYVQTASSDNWTGEIRDFSLKVAEKDWCPGCPDPSSKPSLSSFAPPKVVVAPGFHCYAQSFEVIEFFSAPQVDGGCHSHLCGTPYAPEYNCYRLLRQLPYTNTDPMSTYWYTPFARPVRYFTEGASSGKAIWTNYWSSHSCKPSISSSCSSCCELTNETAVTPEELSNKPVGTIACGVEWVRPDRDLQISVDDCDAMIMCAPGFTKNIFYNNLSYMGPWLRKTIPPNYHDFRPPWCNPSWKVCCSCEPTPQASLNPWLIKVVRCANGESLGYATVGANSPLLGAGYIVNNGTDNLCARGWKVMRVHNGASSATLNAGHTLMGQPATNCQDCVGNYGI